MVISARSAGGMAAIWLFAVVGVSATAWFAIDRAGRDITHASAKTLPPVLPVLPVPTITPTGAPEPTGTSTTPPATPKASVTPKSWVAPKPSVTPRHTRDPKHFATPTPSAAPTSTPPAPPTPQDRTKSVDGGLVSVRCTGSTIALLIAQPENGWSVQVNTYGQPIYVTFQTGEEESQSKIQVTAVCTNGAPVFTTNRAG
jgi:hypothetical protein